MADTTAMTVPIPVHRVVVRSDDHEYRAECWCGWVSGWHPSLVAAGVAGSEHRDAAADPPAPCPDGEVLARAAERLGAPVRVDVAADRQGYRYARAVRRFGRVEIEAHAATGERVS